jgi:integrase
MPSKRLYQIGPFWLGKEANTNKYYMYWHDKRTRRTSRKTTGTSDFRAAIQAITAHHIAHLEPEKEGGLSVRQVALKYWQDHAQNLINSGTPRTSFYKLSEFLNEHEGSGPALQADEWSRETTKALIKWMKENPSYSEKRIPDPDGGFKVIKTPRPQTDKTINRHLDDIRAAFRYCMDRPPIIKGIVGAQTREGRPKPTLSLDQCRKLFAYAYASPDRQHLQAYLIAAFTTLARPDAILDISVSPIRQQVEWDYRRLHLNPAGRRQTKKYRPIVPINDYLLPHLQAAQERTEAALLDPEIKTNGYLVEYKGKPLAAIRQTWNRAKTALGWPMVRDYDAKMIRHTMAKWLRAQGVPWTELEGHLGHRLPSTSETYAEFAPDYLGHVQAEITRFMGQVFEGQNWNCSQIAPNFNKDIVSINSKMSNKSKA